MVNHSYIQLIPRKQTNENTIENVSSTLLRDFVSEVLTILDRITGTANPHSPLHVNQRRSRAKVKTHHFPIPDFLGGGGGGYKFSILIYFVQDSTGSRGDVFVVRTSKPVENLWKNGLFMIALQFRYTFYRPQTKRRHFVPRSPFGRDAVRQRGYGLRLLIFKSRSGSDKKRRNRLQFTVDL